MSYQHTRRPHVAPTDIDITPLPNMHRAWNVDDIWHMISQLLDRSDLKALALTCVHLGECASDALWAEVTDPVAFVCRLPSDWRERPLTLQDVARLDQRFSKIRTIDFHSKTVPPAFRHTKELISENKKKNYNSLWLEIAALRPQTQAFPALRVIEIHNAHRDVLVPVVGISGRQLRTLHLSGVHGKKRKSITRDFVHNAQELTRPPARDADTHLSLLGRHVQSPLDAIQLRPRLHAPGVEHAQAYLETNKSIVSRQFNKTSVLSPFNLSLRHAWETLHDQLDLASTLDVLTAYYLTNRASRFGLAGTDQTQDFAADMSRLSLDLKKILPALDHLDAAGALATVIYKAVEIKPRDKHKQLTDLIMSLQGWPAMFTATAWDVFLNGQSFIDSLSITLPNLQSLELSSVPQFLNRYDSDVYRAYAEQMPSLEYLQLGLRDKSFTVWSCERKEYKKDNMVPIRHLAAFFSLLPALKTVGLPLIIDEAYLDPDPSIIYAARALTTVSFRCLTARPESYKVALANLDVDLSTYFPNAQHHSGKIAVYFTGRRATSIWDPRPRSYIEHRLQSWNN